MKTIILLTFFTLFIIACDRTPAGSGQQSTPPISNKPSLIDSQPKNSSLPSQEPYAPTSISWRDIYLGMPANSYVSSQSGFLSPFDTTNTTETDKGWGKIMWYNLDDKKIESYTSDPFGGGNPSWHSLPLAQRIDFVDMHSENKLVRSSEGYFLLNHLVSFEVTLNSSSITFDEVCNKLKEKYGPISGKVTLRNYYGVILDIKYDSYNGYYWLKHGCSIFALQSEYSTQIVLQDDMKINALLSVARVAQKAKKDQAENERRSTANKVKF